jgi:hypothetical protein
VTTPLETFAPPAAGDGDVWLPRDNYGHPIIVKVREKRTGVITANSPDGTDALLVDLVDLTDGSVSRDVLWFGGGIVDPLSGYVGGNPMVIVFVAKTSKSGRSYPTPEPGDAATVTYAQQWLAANGDPFVPKLSPMASPAAAAPAPIPAALPLIAGPAPVTPMASTIRPTPAPVPATTTTGALKAVPADVYAAMANAGVDVSGYFVAP